MRDMSDTPEVTVDDLERALRDGATVVDVREPGEYAEGHVPGARLIPMGQLPGRVEELDDSGPVYVLCAAGNRSSAMADLLVERGLDARSVAGGTTGWTSSGRSVVTGTEPR